MFASTGAAAQAFSFLTASCSFNELQLYCKVPIDERNLIESGKYFRGGNEQTEQWHLSS
jgi:hypothetical protein